MVTSEKKREIGATTKTDILKPQLQLLQQQKIARRNAGFRL